LEEGEKIIDVLVRRSGGATGYVKLSTNLDNIIEVGNPEVEGMEY
jgi:hypothetical protein